MVRYVDTPAPLKGAGKLCWESRETGYAVRLYQRGRDRFTVQYGLQVKDDLNYEQAACVLGACIMHQLACNDLLDNRERGEV